MKEIKIGNFQVGSAHPPFIVAEVSGNHRGSLEQAFKLIDAAKKAGVQAVKLQTYTPDTITLNSQESAFQIDDPKSLWHQRRLYELYQEAHLPWEWHAPLFTYCRKLGLLLFSTPFDESAVDFLEQFDPPCYKIASPEIVDHALIRKAAATGKPLLLSTGAASLVEIGEAVEAARSAGCTALLLMRCTAAYPARHEDAHLRTLSHLSASFGTPVGLSDHTLGVGAALAGIALGASLIEKHTTFSRMEGGVDAAFSLEPAEMQQLVTEALQAWKALGEIHYGVLPAEKMTHSHRPSLYFIEDLEAGTVVLAQHVRSLRPSEGLPPKELEKLVGLTLERAVRRGNPVSWNLFK